MCGVRCRPADDVAHKRRWQDAGLGENVMALAIAKEGAVFLGKLAVDLHVKVVFVDDQQRAIEEVVSSCTRSSIVRLCIFLIKVQNIRAGLINQWIVDWNEVLGVSDMS